MKTTNDFPPSQWQALENLILEKCGYWIHYRPHLRQAFTRSSYTALHGGQNNEILEFIGDQVLGMYVVKLIADRCGGTNAEGEFSFRLRENRFTAIRQELVSNEALARIIDDWGVMEYLIVGESDVRNRVDQQAKVKADLFEAILGAIALSSKWDPAVLEKAVRRMLDLDARLGAMIVDDCRTVPFDPDNAVTVAKELAEKGYFTAPRYEYAGPEDLGHDKNGDPIWCCTCTIVNDRRGITRQVWGSSKKLCKKFAAYLVLCEHFGLQNGYGTNDFRAMRVTREGALTAIRSHADITGEAT